MPAYKQLMDLIANGEPVTGKSLVGLPCFAPSKPVDPERDYQGDESGLLLEAMVAAARLAKEASNNTSIDWLTDTVNLHIDCDAAHAAGERPSEELRAFAWQLGTQAEFAAGLRRGAG